MVQDSPQIPQKDTTTEVHKGDSHSNVLVEFGRSAFYSGVVNPLRSVAQIADHFGETRVFEDRVKTATHNLGIEAPKADKFGTTTWYAQQLGDAVGMMVDYGAVRHVTNLTTGKVLTGLGKGTIEELHVNAMKSTFGSASMAKFAGAEAGLSAASGYAYGFLLRPSDEKHVGTAAFWSDRNRQGLDNGSTFGIIGGMNPYMGRTLGMAANALERTGTAQTLSLTDTAITTARNGLSASLRGPILPGVITGIPIGAVNAEVSAVQNGKWLPEKQDLKEQIVSMMFVGGAIGAGNWVVAPRIGTDRTNFSYISDGVRTAASIGVDKVNLTLGRGVLIDRYTNYYGDNASLLPNLQEHSGYRVQVDRTVQSPNINHQTKMISLSATADSAFRMIPLADISKAAHELGHGAPPALAAAKALQATDQSVPGSSVQPLSESAYVDWRVSREQAAREHERHALVALDRTDEAARIITDRDSILGQKISPSGITYNAHFAQDFGRSQGRTNHPIVEHHENGGNAAAKASSELGTEQVDVHRAAIRSDLARALSKGQIDSAKELIDLKLLTADDLKTDKIREAAQQGLAEFLSKGWINDAKELVNLKLLTADDLKTDKIREAAQHGLATCLSKGQIREPKELIDLKLLTADDLKTNEIREAAQHGLATCLSKGRIREPKELIDLKLLTAEDLKTDKIREAAQQGLAKGLSEGWSGLANHIIDLKLVTAEDLKTDKLREAAQHGLAKDLSEGQFRQAKQLIDLKLLTADDLKTDKIREAAQHGLATCLSKGQIRGPKELIDLKLLTADDLKTNEIREAAQHGLATCLSKGQIREPKELIDLKLLTAEDLKTDKIREAAQQGLAKGLSEGQFRQAKELIDLKLLTAEDLKTDKIREAAQQGLTKGLSEGWSDGAKELIDLKLLDQEAIDACFKESAQAGHVTTVIRTALATGTDLNTAFDRYLGISKLTDENATTLITDLKSRDTNWHDEANIQRPFEEGATLFGAARMLRYVFKANATPHDALFAFHDIAQLYDRSGLSKDNFYNNVLRQVNRDDAVNDSGSSFSRLNAIAKGFPESIDSVLEKTKNYPDIETLQKLAASLPDAQSVFASWPNLQRFAKLQQLVERTELLPQLQQLRQDNPKLANWLETVLLHPDSKIPAQPGLDFWQKPESFLDYRENHAPESHEQKKPSHYTDIPHLDLSAEQLRDALVDGTLDRVQVFSPMQVEYEVGGPNIAAELKRALGSRQASQQGEAKNVGKLFSEVNKLLKPANFSLTQIQEGVEPPAELRQQLEAVLYNNQFGGVRPPSGLRLVAEIHRKSDPLAVVAGDDTASCMGFGTGKNNVYMFNPNDALFTVRLVREDGTSRTIAQSVLTKDKDVKVPFPTILEKMQGNDKTALHTIFPEDALRSEQSVIAADNVEVHPNYQSGTHPAALQSVYKDFFGRYVELHGKDENLRDDKIIIGLGYSDAMNSLPKEPNTYVPQAPIGYTDKSHAEVLSLSLKAPPTTPLRVLKVTNNEVENRIKPQPSAVRGVTPLTFEDTLSLAYVEGKVFQDSPSLRQGLHNMENALIAKDINNAAKGRPNLSVKYADINGKMKGYLLAYEGEGTFKGEKQPVVFIGDFTSDGRTAPDGSHVLSFVGGKMLLEFGRLYKENYLDKGELMPIFANARDKTSYNLLMRQIEVLGAKVGCRFEVQEIGTHQSDSSTMHDVLIIPHRI